MFKLINFILISTAQALAGRRDRESFLFFVARYYNFYTHSPPYHKYQRFCYNNHNHYSLLEYRRTLCKINQIWQKKVFLIECCVYFLYFIFLVQCVIMNFQATGELSTMLKKVNANGEKSGSVYASVS